MIDSIANAVCFFASDMPDFRYIARSVVDTGGNTTPAQKVATKSSGSGARLVTAHTNSSNATACAIASGITTRCGPF